MAKKQIKTCSTFCHQRNTNKTRHHYTLFTITRTWKQPKCSSTEEWMKMWYIQWNFSHKKEWNNTISSNMGGPRDYYTKWSQTKISIIWYHLHMESNFLKWYKWTYIQNRNKLTDFFFFSWCGPFLKSLLNLLQYCFCFMFWFSGHASCGILPPWTRNLTPTLSTERWILNHWTTREFPHRSWNQTYGYQRRNVRGSDKSGEGN